MTFEDFDLDYDVLDGIAAMGYKAPTPIQQQAIPVILKGRDIIGCAQTGTGKTAAYVLPLLDKIMQTPSEGINTLILVPTRELAQQIDQQIEAMSYFVNVSSIAVYGGGSGNTWNQQKKALSGGVDIVIATPGRLIAQMQMGGMDFSNLKFLVLDEADRMLDMGFYDDISNILMQMPVERQTLCFSATMAPKIRKLTEQFLRNPVEISISVSKPAEGIRQLAYLAHDEQKLQLLLHVLKGAEFKSAIIFSSTKERVKKLEPTLNKAGIPAKAFHSDLEQEERERLMQAFKSGKIAVLIGTDVLSRGIDVDGIDLVLNYDVPPDPEDYVHRVGRTARAQRTGTAITFINSKDARRFSFIEKLIEREVEKVPLPDGYGPSPEYQTGYSEGRDKKSRGGGKSGGGKKHPAKKTGNSARSNNKSRGGQR